MRKFVSPFLILALVLAGCSPSSLEDFHNEGAAWCRKLAKELSLVESREELVEIELRIKKRFEELVDLMIEARQVQLKNPEEYLLDFTQMDNPDALALKEELMRIYSIEGAREVIERAQREAMIRLDAFERHMRKQQSR